MTRTMLRMVAAVVLCFAAVLAGTSAANASTPGSIAPSAARPAGGTQALFDSTCQTIGGDQYGNFGVACADLFIGHSGGTEYLQSENEIYCVNAVAVVDCEGIQETVATCFAGGQGCPDPKSGICGRLWGHSDCGARDVENWSDEFTFDGCYPNTWADALNTEIVLPDSGKEIGGQGTNVASAHFPAGCNA